MEGGRPIGRGPKSDARLRGEHVRLGTRRRRSVRGDVVVGKDACELIVTERFEVTSRREMLRSPIPLGEGLVGDLADDTLDEPDTGRASARAGPRRGLEDLVAGEPVELG